MPSLIGELPLQVAGGNGRPACNVPWRFVAPRSLDLVPAHDACNAMLAAVLTRLAQIRKHTASTIDPVAGRVGLTDQLEQAPVFLFVSGDRLVQPRIKPCTSHSQQSAYQADGVMA